MSHDYARFAFTILIALGFFSGMVGREIAKKLIPNQETQNTVGIVTGFTVALSSIVGVVAWRQIQQNKRIDSVVALVNTEEVSGERIDRKISYLFQKLDDVRNYERHAVGIGDFTPFIQVHRYIRPSTETINNINNLEQTLITYIAQHGDEKAVDDAINTVIEVAQNLIDQLDKAK